MKLRFSPTRIRNRIFKNRVVVPPMASETASPDGFVTETALAHYRRLSESGAALVIAEYTFVHPSGKSEPRQLGAFADDQIEGLRKLAATIHESGSLAGLQLTHSGGKSDLEDVDLMAPSGVTVPVKDRVLPRPRPMSQDDIKLWKRSFHEAGRRAVLAGFDGIELHSAHGYGLNQWLSPLTNHRTDAYGGSLENRARLLFEIVEDLREEFPGLLISVRIPGQDFIEGGLEIEETARIARELELRGVDLIHVSSGIGGWRRPAPRTGEGYLVEEAAVIQARVHLPVIGVGGIETGDYIDRAILERKFSFAAVGRAILKDPRRWRNEHLTEEANFETPASAQGT